MTNPNALINPKAMEAFRGAFARIGGEAGAGLADRILEVLRGALASAIGDVFLVALFGIAVSFVVTAFIKEVPLQDRKPRVEG